MTYGGGTLKPTVINDMYICMSILFAYSLMWKLVVNTTPCPNWVTKFNACQ